MNAVKEFVENNRQLMLDTHRELCVIPAPSHMEHRRAAYCKQWLENIGAQGVYIDEALNVIFPLNAEGSNELTVFAAHTDTVFPDLEPMPYTDDGEKIHCPGAADDTASVAVLLVLAKYCVEKQLTPPKGMLFVMNSCEEGLGDLKGSKQLFKDYAGRIASFITFDGNMTHIVQRSVGSHRYEVEVITPGGHSFGKFGAPNAIAHLAQMVSEIYKLEVPQKENTRTTYNVGTISGGTSVNTIAQNAKMLCEYRSDDPECLAMMEAAFMKIFEAARQESVQVKVTKVGDRPCGNVAEEKLDALKKVVVPIVEEAIGTEVQLSSGSTDCNIPHSMGIPALCVGVDIHEGTHTRQEWVDKASMITGTELAIKLAQALSK